MNYFSCCLLLFFSLIFQTGIVLASAPICPNSTITASCVGPYQGVVINELSGDGGNIDSRNDAIVELAGPAGTDIGCMVVTNGEWAVVLPAGTTIPADGVFVIGCGSSPDASSTELAANGSGLTCQYCDFPGLVLDFDVCDPANANYVSASLLTNYGFTLDNGFCGTSTDGDQVILFQPGGIVQDAVFWGGDAAHLAADGVTTVYGGADGTCGGAADHISVQSDLSYTLGDNDENGIINDYIGSHLGRRADGVDATGVNSMPTANGTALVGGVSFMPPGDCNANMQCYTMPGIQDPRWVYLGLSLTGCNSTHVRLLGTTGDQSVPSGDTAHPSHADDPDCSAFSIPAHIPSGCDPIAAATEWGISDHPTPALPNDADTWDLFVSICGSPLMEVSNSCNGIIDLYACEPGDVTFEYRIYNYQQVSGAGNITTTGEAGHTNVDKLGSFLDDPNVAGIQPWTYNANTTTGVTTLTYTATAVPVGTNLFKLQWKDYIYDCCGSSVNNSNIYSKNECYENIQVRVNIVAPITATSTNLVCPPLMAGAVNVATAANVTGGCGKVYTLYANNVSVTQNTSGIFNLPNSLATPLKVQVTNSCPMGGFMAPCLVTCNVPLDINIDAACLAPPGPCTTFQGYDASCTTAVGTYCPGTNISLGLNSTNIMAPMAIDWVLLPDLTTSPYASNATVVASNTVTVCPTPSGPVRINEILFNAVCEATAGNDYGERIELAGTPGTSISCVVVSDGDFAFQLPANAVIQPDGFFLIGRSNSTCNTGSLDFDVATLNTVYADMNLTNGGEFIGIFASTTGFPLISGVIWSQNATVNPTLANTPNGQNVSILTQPGCPVPSTNISILDPLPGTNPSYTGGIYTSGQGSWFHANSLNPSDGQSIEKAGCDDIANLWQVTDNELGPVGPTQNQTGGLTNGLTTISCNIYTIPAGCDQTLNIAPRISPAYASTADCSGNITPTLPTRTYFTPSCPDVTLTGTQVACASDPTPNLSIAFTNAPAGRNFTINYTIDGNTTTTTGTVPATNPFTFPATVSGLYELIAISFAPGSPTICQATVQGTAEVIINPAVAATLTASTPITGCNSTSTADDGSVTFTFEGPGPYLVTYTVDGVEYEFSTNSNPSVLTTDIPGTYALVSVINVDSGCEGTVAADNVTVAAPAGNPTVAATTREICNDGSAPSSVDLSAIVAADVSASPSTGTFQWFNVDPTLLSNAVRNTLALSGASLTAAAPTTSTEYYFVYKLANECETIGSLTINLVSCCPTIDTPLGNQTICAGATASTLAVGTNVTAASEILFKYFTAQQTEASIIYGSGTTLTGGVNITNGTATYTPLSSDFNNTTTSPITYYVYAVLNPTPADLTACSPYAEITVLVNPIPTLTCPSQFNAACNASLQAGANTSVDFNALPGALSNATSYSFSDLTSTDAATCLETTVRTYVVTLVDCTASCNQTLTRTVDITAPSATCPPAPVVSACNGAWPAAYATAADFTLAGGTLTDACSTIAMSSSDVTVAGGCDETLTRTYLFTDACNNTVTCDQIITRKVDLTAPTAVCPPAPVVSACNGAWPAAYATAADFTLAGGTLTDACSTIAMSSSDVTAASGCNETLTRTYLFTDACNNTVSCDQIITRKVDLTAPTAVCPTAPVVSACNGAWPVAYATAADFTLAGGTLTDACSTIAMSSSDVTAASGCNETLTRTYLFTDACNNTVTCDQIIVRKVDITAPSATCPPAPVVSACNGAWPAAYAAAADFTIAGGTLTDACSTIAMSSSDVTVAGGCDETLTRTYLFTDACNNTVTCDQIIVRKVDITAPSATCPPAPVVSACNGAWPAAYAAAADFTLAGGTLTDACSTIAMSSSDVTVAGGCDETLTRTYLFTDACNNTVTCDQIIVRKVDITAPSATCPAAPVVSACNGAWPAAYAAAADFTLAGGTLTDACSTIAMSSSDVTAASGCNETLTRTYLFTDACNNTVTCDQIIVRKVDLTAPTAVCPTAPVVSACNGAWPAAYATADDFTLAGGTLTDACSTIAMSSSDVTVAGGCDETLTRTYLFTDACNNTVTCDQIITRKVDLTAPTASCPAALDLTICDEAWPTAFTTVDDFTLAGGTLTDACSTLAVSSSDVTIASGCNESLTRTYLFTDACNNTVTCTQLITRKVSVAIMLTCAADITVSGLASQADLDTDFASWLGTASMSGGCSPILSNNGVGLAPNICIGGSVDVTFTVSSAFMCDVTTSCVATYTYNSAALPIVMSGSTICFGQSGTAEAAGGTMWVWSTGANTSLITESPVATTTYTVTVTNSLGCTTVSNATIVINPLPTATALSSSVCTGTEGTLTASGGVSYIWSDGITTSANLVSSVAGSYSVTVTDINGCTATSSASITIFPEEAGPAIGSLTVCQGESTNITLSSPRCSNIGNPVTIAYGFENTVTLLPVISGSGSTLVAGVGASLGAGASGPTFPSGSPSPAMSGASWNTSVVDPTAYFQFCTDLAPDGCELNLTSLTFVNQRSGTGPPLFDIRVSTTGPLGIFNELLTGQSTSTTIVAPAYTTAFNINTTSSICFRLYGYGGNVSATSGTWRVDNVTFTGQAYQELPVLCNVYDVDPSSNPGAIPVATDVTVYDPATTVATSPDVFWVKCEDINGCLSQATAVSVTVNALPDITIAGNLSVCTGLTTDLTANGGASYTWSTGATTDLVSVSEGTYTVSVTNAEGCISAKEVTVVLYPAVTAVITGNLTICDGTSTVLTASGGVSSTWSTSETTADITVTTAGLYEVIVTSADGCTSITGVTVVVNPLPTALATNATVCPGATGDLIASGGVSYLWSDASTSATLTTSTVGVYTVTVTDINGCTSSTTAELVNFPGAVALATNATVCPGASGDLIASGGVSYLWSDASTSATLTTSTVAVYTVTVTDINGCTSSTTAELINFPGAVALATNATVCPGVSGDLVASGGVSYQWSDASTSATLTTSTVAVYMVTVTDINGCTSSTTAELVNFPGAVASATSSTVCTGFDGTMTASGGVSYAWSNGPITDINITNVAGTYEVTVTDLNGCISTTTATLTINNSAPAAVSNVTVCTGLDGTLLASGGISYIWSDGITTSANFVSSVAGSYTVTVTDINGCTGVSTAEIVNYPLAVALATNATVCPGVSGDLVASGGVSYLWSDASTSATLTTSTAGVYTVTVTDINGCISSTTAELTNFPGAVALAANATVCPGVSGLGSKWRSFVLME
ncbi:MAG: hypothetical protein IPO14_10795 [Saprospiraceae bacterium]|nr:hypothetical protein [Saprospiraceae bacterium]